MKRILLIGPGGAGKTTLARKLEKTLQLPMYSLDTLWWQSGWKHVSREEFERKLAAILAIDAWIIDGNYPRTLPERLKFADAVVYLDFPLALCWFRVLKRMIFHYGKTLPEMPAGCSERLDWAFLSKVRRFRRDTRPGLEAALQRFPGKIIRLRNSADVKLFLRDIGEMQK